MSEPWVAAVASLVVAMLFAYGVLAVWVILRVRPKKLPPTRLITYECGEEPDGIAWIRFHPRYYLVALVFVPIVLVYQGWTYWVFRHRISAETKLEY